MWPLILTKILPLLTGPVSQFVTGININQVLSTTIDFVNTAFKFIVKHWQLSLIILLILGNIVGAYGTAHYHKLWTDEKISHTTDVKSYKDAQAKADADARAQVKQIIQESKVKADATDKNYSDLLAKYHASLLRYSANQSGSKPTDQRQGDSEAGQVTKGTDGSGSSPGLFITLKDAQICADNTARLVAAHDWAIHLGDDVNETP